MKFLKYKEKIDKQKLKKILKQILVIVLIVVVINLFFGFGRINSKSMEPSYTKGKFIIVNKITSYTKGDVVLVKYDGKYMLRRVIGEENDVIKINNKKGIVYINDVKEDTKEAQGTTVTDPLGIKFPVTVGEDQYFLLTDQRDYTSDSRLYGCMNEKYIIGKVILEI